MFKIENVNCSRKPSGLTRHIPKYLVLMGCGHNFID